MDKGISVYFGFLGDIKQRLIEIKETGFTTIMTNADSKFDWQNGTIKKQVKLIKKVGLKLDSLHASYEVSQLKYFFEEGPVGDKLEKNLIKDIKIAKKYGFRCVVVHFKGNKTQIGLQRIKRVLVYCNKYKVPLAVENIDADKTFDFIFNNISDPYLRFCYDSGHNKIFDPERNYLREFGDKLVALHLHDNDGISDQHTLNQFGVIDWKEIAKDLAQCENLPPLDYELLLHKHNAKLTQSITLNMCYKNACKLEDMIKLEKRIKER